MASVLPNDGRAFSGGGGERLSGRKAMPITTIVIESPSREPMEPENRRKSVIQITKIRFSPNRTSKCTRGYPWPSTGES